jgi:hypothetical protein
MKHCVLIYDEAFYVLIYDTTQRVKIPLTFQRITLPPSSDLKNKPKQETSIKQVASRAGFFFADLEDGGDMFLQNAD